MDDGAPRVIQSRRSPGDGRVGVRDGGRRRIRKFVAGVSLSHSLPPVLSLRDGEKLGD
jgi:hypothetical protein